MVKTLHPSDDDVALHVALYSARHKAGLNFLRKYSYAELEKRARNKLPYASDIDIIINNSHDKAWKAKKSFLNYGEYLSYMTVIVYNCCYDYVKAQKKEKKSLRNYGMVTFSDDPDVDMEMHEIQRDAVKKALAQMPDGMKKKIIGDILNNHTNNDIAIKYGISADEVRTYRHRGVKWLKQNFLHFWKKKLG